MTLRAPREGDPLSSSAWFQPVADRLNKAGGAKATDTPPNAQQSAASGIDSGVIVGEQASTITVTMDIDDVTVIVAKPPALRGNIRTRINSDGAEEEIFPAYSPGVRVIVGEVTDTGIEGVTWADVNWGSRRWTIEV